MTARTARTATALLAAAALAALAGCSPNAGGVFTSGDGTVLLVATPQTYGDGAQVKGPLAKTNGGYVGVSIEGSIIPVVWPAGTRFEDTGAVVVPGAGSFTLGGQVSGAGDYYHFDRAHLAGLDASSLEALKP